MSFYLAVGGQKYNNIKSNIQNTEWIDVILSILGVRNLKIQKTTIAYAT